MEQSSISFPLTSSQQNLFDIHLVLYVQSQAPDDGRKDRPQHVECYYYKKNKFEKLVHLFGFTVEIYHTTPLTFKNRASHIQDRQTVPLQMLHFMYFFSTNISTKYFKHAAHSPFFSSKCRLFDNATFFGSCIIHILHAGCAKI